MSTENAEQPVKRKSVADMWREREQAALEKQQQPYKPTVSPPRRSINKNFEEKKIEGAAAATTNNSSNATATSKSASTNAAGGASQARRPVSTKSKFAMMGQKHAARPKKLPSYQQYQQPAKRYDPKSPESTNSDALLEGAFDDAVQAQQGNKFSTELGSRRRAQQSEYSSLQVSDSASIPKDVHPKHSTDVNDDESNISGLSSPGSPARSSRNQRRSNAMPETPENDKSMDQESFDSEGYSRGGKNSVSPRSAGSPGRDDVSEGVVAESFVEESDKEVSAFQDAMKKMSLGDIANDIKEEATAVFDGLGIDKLQNNLNEGMAKFGSFFAQQEEAPAQAEKSAMAGETPAEGDAAATPTENSETPENVEPKPESVSDGPATETKEAVAETTEAVTEEFEVEAEPAAPVAEPDVTEEFEVAAEPDEPVAAEAVEALPSEMPETAPEEALLTENNDKSANAPDPPLEAADSSEVFDPFASTEPGDFADFSAFPDDAFSNDFAAPSPAATPAPAPAPVLPKKESSPQTEPVSAPPKRTAQEDVAIEVEYLEDSDDDQADV